MKRLFVKLDEIAAIRELKKKKSPEPVAVAVFAELGGADGVAIRFSESRKNVKDQDIKALRRMIQSSLILEMGFSSEMVGIALEVRPEIAILLPPETDHSITEAPLDLIVHYKDIIEVVSTLQNHGIEVGVLIHPEMEQVKLAHQANIDRIQIFSQDYCDAANHSGRQAHMDRIVHTIKLAKKLKMKISIGRGLDYSTVKAFEGIEEIDAFSIGHSIISRALYVGMKDAVSEMVSIIQRL